MQKGFTLIEVMIVIAIIVLLASVGTALYSDGTLCRGGYKFVFVDANGGVRQLLDAAGKGVPCGASRQ